MMHGPIHINVSVVIVFLVSQKEHHMLLLRLWSFFQSVLEIAEQVKPRPLPVNSLFINPAA